MIVAFLTILVIIVVVIKVAVIEVRVAVVKVMVWVAAIGGMVVVVGVLSIDVLAGVEIIAVGGIVIVLEFALPVSYSVDMPSSGVAVDLFMDGIVIEVLPDVRANTFAVFMTALTFPFSTPLEEFSR